MAVTKTEGKREQKEAGGRRKLMQQKGVKHLPLPPSKSQRSGSRCYEAGSVSSSLILPLYAVGFVCIDVLFVIIILLTPVFIMTPPYHIFISA